MSEQVRNDILKYSFPKLIEVYNTIPLKNCTCNMVCGLTVDCFYTKYRERALLLA
jgi:hypothetical protein